MGAHLAGAAGHATVGSFYDYNRPEHEKVMGSGLVSVFRGDGRFLGRFNRQELEAIARGAGLRSRMRADSNPGQELGFTLPADVLAAMKHKGHLASPNAAFSILAPSAKSAMKKLNEDAFGRTTDGEPVPVNLYFAFMYGFTNRAGEIAPQINVWVFGYGQAANGKHYAVDFRRLYNGQKTTQAVWHMAVAEKLLERGIICVPNGNSIRALGVRAQTTRSRQVNAVLLATPFTGPAARARVVRQTRSPKPSVSWAESVRNLAYKVSDRVEGTLKAISAWRQEKLAERCVKAAFHYHNRSGAARYSRRDAFATGAHLALPQVSPELYSRVFDRLNRNPERLGAELAKIYPDGNILYAPKKQVALEAKAAKVLHAGQATSKGGLSRHQVARALAGRGLDVNGYAAVQRIADRRRVVLDPDIAGDTAAIRNTATAYAHRKRSVYAVGAEAGKVLGKPAYTPLGFAERVERTPHLTALWRGLRTSGSLKDRLGAAERIRAAKHPAHLKRNSLIVVSPHLEDTRALLRILRAARKTNSKVVFTGSGVRDFADLAGKHAVKQRQKGARM